MCLKKLCKSLLFICIFSVILSLIFTSKSYAVEIKTDDNTESFGMMGITDTDYYTENGLSLGLGSSIRSRGENYFLTDSGRGVAIFLNLFPLFGCGLGSFLQSDIVGGLVELGLTVLGISFIVGGLAMEGSDGGSIALVTLGSLSLIGTIIVSIVKPLYYNKQGSKERARVRDTSQGHFEIGFSDSGNLALIYQLGF